MATAPSPNDLTRQQLDELDALLQRMLSVPLSPADTPAPPTNRGAEAEPPLPPSWRVDPPVPAAGIPAPHIALPDPPSSVALKLEPPAPAPAPAPAPVPPPPPAPKPVAPAPKITPAPLPAAKPAAVSAPAAPAAVTPAPAAPPVALPLLPLVALNSVFDAACGVLGPPGRLLRSGFFKYLYGLAGLGLLAYTAAHVAQVQGWITLPVPLPWPR